MNDDAPKTLTVASPITSFVFTSWLRRGLVTAGGFLVAVGLMMLCQRHPYLMAVFFAPLMLMQMIPARALIGEDGLRVRWLGMRSFMPWRDVNAVEIDQTAPGVRFFLKNGTQRVVAVPSYQRSFNTPSESARFDAGVLLAHVETALVRYRKLQIEAPAPALPIEAEGVVFAQWRELVRNMAHSEGSYREAAVDRAALRDVVRRATTRASVRAAAAYVLMSSKAKSEEDAACVEAARQGTANDRLRVALDALSSERDERMEDALAELHREDEVRRRL